MLVLLLFKVLLSYCLMMKFKSEKLVKIVNIGLDIFIIFGFFYIIYIQEKVIIIEILFDLMMFFIIIFLLYRLLYYGLKNSEKIISGMEKKEKMKDGLLKPVVCKSIYYMVGMLPGNLPYGIYFGIMENGGYFRVGICSNRDIFFKKYFGGDSRDFFFNLNERILENKKMKFFLIRKDKVHCMTYRLLYIFYGIRKKMLSIKIVEYICIRIIVYMYLTIFYLYAVFFLHLINSYLLLLLIVIEVLLLYHIGSIIVYFQIIQSEDGTEEKIAEYKEEGGMTEELIELIEFIKYPLIINEDKYKGMSRMFIWDKTLSNSVTLNILYKYMIGVNKNTKGYYDRKMNIRSRIHRRKYIEEKSIIGDVLPRTRYVIMDLKNRKYKSGMGLTTTKFFFNERSLICLSNNKNFYLSYYEKAYSKTSLLMMVYILRVNPILGTLFSNDYGFFCLNKNKDGKYFYFLLKSYKMSNEHKLYFIVLLYLMEKDSRLKFVKFLHRFVNDTLMLFDLDDKYIISHGKKLREKAKELDIPETFCSMDDYKLMFLIMGRIQLYEEEAIVGNLPLQEYLTFIDDYIYNHQYDLLGSMHVDKALARNFDGISLVIEDFQYYCQMQFIYIIFMENENQFEKIEEVDFNNTNSMFFKQYEEEDHLHVIYKYMLMVLLRGSNNFIYEGEVDGSEELSNKVGFPEDLDHERLKDNFM